MESAMTALKLGKRDSRIQELQNLVFALREENARLREALEIIEVTSQKATAGDIE